MDNRPIRIADQPKTSPKRAKRPRAARACERCREKKYKCDESYPCSRCTKSRVECIFEGNYHLQDESRTASYVHDLERRIEELTAQLRNSTSNQHQRHSNEHSEFWTTRNGPSILNPEIRTDDNEQSSSEAVEGEEILEVNRHTNSIEFHGNTSSAAALGQLQKKREPVKSVVHDDDYDDDDDDDDGEDEEPTTSAHQGESAQKSIVSTLHNPNFQIQSPQLTQDANDVSFRDRNFYFEHAHVFIEGYFENLHFIHPIIDKENFVSRAHDLWMGRNLQPANSFIALYLSLLSLGALTRVWDQPQLGGLGRFEWSRKLFTEAQGFLHNSLFTNDLEIIQALYLMAKVCQNELTPHLAYMYLGLAIRTCLAAGFNRETSSAKSRRHDWISKTWWGLYSLEIEMSFSLGRPDTLGMDEYHNRSQPGREEVCDSTVIPIMVDCARIVRSVSIDIYHSGVSTHERLQRSLQIESRLDAWLEELPEILQPSFGRSRQQQQQGLVPISSLRDPKWSRRQRLVLEIRYHNIKMILFRPFLAYLTSTTEDNNSNNWAPEAQTVLEMAARKCIDSSKKTVDIIYETFRQHTFFRCWWYNTTYIMFAVTNLLLLLLRGPTSLVDYLEANTLRDSVKKTIEILEAMDESVVARKSVEIVKSHFKEYCDGDEASQNQQPQQQQQQLDSETGASISQPDMAINPEAFPFGGMSYGEFIPDLTFVTGFPDYPFESMVSLFGDITGPSILD